MNWKKQAAGKAKDYLDYGHFSRSGLIGQLKYEGFSHSQAEYGAAEGRALTLHDVDGARKLDVSAFEE